MKPRLRRAALLAVLLGAAWLKLSESSDQGANVVGPTARASARRTPEAPPVQLAAATTVPMTAPPVAATLRMRPVLDEAGPDLFAGPTLTAVPQIPALPRAVAPVTMPPPPPVAVAPVPAISAPAPPPVFNLRVLGQYEIDGTKWAFFAAPHGTVAVQPGQPIDPEWRLDAIEPHRIRVAHISSGHLAHVEGLNTVPQ